MNSFFPEIKKNFGFGLMRLPMVDTDVDIQQTKDMVDAYNAENPETKLVILDEAMTTEPYAFAFKLGGDDLVGKINEILNKMLADGTIAEIFEKYNAPYTAP